MYRKSHEATHLVFKYYVSKEGGVGVKACADNADTWWVGGGNLGKLADVILEHFRTLRKLARGKEESEEERF